MKKYPLLAVSVLTGTIVGAGIFALPYVFRTLGLGLSIAYLIFFALVYFCVHLMYAELVKKHRGTHEFFFLANQYLPRPLVSVASFLILAELVFVLVAYLAISSSFLKLFLPFNDVKLTAIFWLAGSIFIFAPLKWLSRIELLGVLGIGAIIFLVFFAGGWGGQTISFQPIGRFGVPLLFLPFGPILFALSGRPAISRVIDLYKESEKKGRLFSLKKAVFWGTMIPAVIYLFFVIAVLRLTPEATADTISGLRFIVPHLLSVLGVLGFFAIWTSYFMIGINIREIIQEDIKWPAGVGVFLAVFLPFLLYLFGLDSFLRVVSFTGGVLLSLEAIFIIVMWRKAFRYRVIRRFSILLYPVFFTAMSYEIWRFFR